MKVDVLIYVLHGNCPQRGLNKSALDIFTSSIFDNTQLSSRVVIPILDQRYAQGGSISSRGVGYTYF